MSWTLYDRSDCLDCKIANAWVKNHGIPVEKANLTEVSVDQIALWAKLCEGGASDLIDHGQYTNPSYKEKLQNLSDDEMVKILASHPDLFKAPILTNDEKIIIGYQPDQLKSTFRFVKVRKI